MRISPNTELTPFFLLRESSPLTFASRSTWKKWKQMCLWRKYQPIRMLLPGCTFYHWKCRVRSWAPSNLQLSIWIIWHSSLGVKTKISGSLHWIVVRWFMRDFAIILRLVNQEPELAKILSARKKESYYLMIPKQKVLYADQWVSSNLHFLTHINHSRS